MALLEKFLDPSFVSLKICGVTTHEDARRLVTMGVDALGVNFWPMSKRYLAESEASWLGDLAGKILRVGVFVNQPHSLPLRLVREGFLDVVQLHGDEKPEDAAALYDVGIPFFKAIGVTTLAELEHLPEFRANAVLLDSHAPVVYGGTGEIFDWEMASEFRRQHPQLPVVLAGGIVAENAALAAMRVKPAALDIASGAEISPGIKDFQKVTAILAALHRNPSC